MCVVDVPVFVGACVCGRCTCVCRCLCICVCVHACIIVSLDKNLCCVNTSVMIIKL